MHSHLAKFLTAGGGFRRMFGAAHIDLSPASIPNWRSPGPPGALAPQQSGRTCGAVVEVEFPRSDPRSIFMGKPAFVDIKTQ